MSPLLLLVEDNDDERTLVAYTLTRAGYRVVTAHSGLEGLELARQCHPDVAILDVILPDVDGFALGESLRNDPGLTSVGIVFLTGCASETAREIGRRMGAGDYVTKPFSPRELLGRIERLLTARRAAHAPTPVGTPLKETASEVREASGTPAVTQG